MIRSTSLSSPHIGGAENRIGKTGFWLMLVAGLMWLAYGMRTSWKADFGTILWVVNGIIVFIALLRLEANMGFFSWGPLRKRKLPGHQWAAKHRKSRWFRVMFGQFANGHDPWAGWERWRANPPRGLIVTDKLHVVMGGTKPAPYDPKATPHPAVRSIDPKDITSDRGFVRTWSRLSIVFAMVNGFIAILYRVELPF